VTGRVRGAGIGVGDLAPEIELPDDQGGVWRLSAHRGRAVVVLFHRHLA
jgi:peroxiredoxin